jgi:hypothetical protein
MNNTDYIIRILLSVFLMLLVVGPVTSVPDAEKSYKLEYRMDIGAEFTMNKVLEHRNQREFMGNEMVNNSTDRLQYHFKVLSSDRTEMTLEMTYGERSHETDDTQFLQPPDFSSLVGSKTSFLISNKGAVSNFTGFDVLPEIVIPDEQTTLDAARYILDVKQTFPELPQEPLGRGESWSYTQSYTDPVEEGEISVTVKVNYTLADKTVIDGTDCLIFEGNYTYTVEGQISAGGMDLTVSLKGGGTDTVYFAWKKGMVLKSGGNLSMTGQAENIELGINIPMQHDYINSLEVEFQ